MRLGPAVTVGSAGEGRKTTATEIEKMLGQMEGGGFEERTGGDIISP
jgi:hypothetical protein